MPWANTRSQLSGPSRKFSACGSRRAHAIRMPVSTCGLAGGLRPGSTSGSPARKFGAGRSISCRPSSDRSFNRKQSDSQHPPAKTQLRYPGLRPTTTIDTNHRMRRYASQKGQAGFDGRPNGALSKHQSAQPHNRQISQRAHCDRHAACNRQPLWRNQCTTYVPIPHRIYCLFQLPPLMRDHLVR
jgi:hypothetical protein